MAERRPLVLAADGELELLQPGDTLSGIAAGPQGPQGSAGPQGAQGVQGPQASSFGNIDGGGWGTNYGATTSIDGGTF